MNYEDGPEINLDKVYPGEHLEKSFSVTNSGTLDFAYTISWDSLTNGIENDELIMQIDCTSYINYGSVNQEEYSSCNSVSSRVVGNNANEPIIDGVFLENGVTHLYNLSIDFIETSSEQNYNQGKVFYGVLKATETTEKVTLSGNLMDVNSNPIVSATVEVHSTVRTGVTDENGYYEITGIPVGEHTIIIKNNLNEVIATDTFFLGTAKDSNVLENEIIWDRTSLEKKLNIVVGESEINQFIIVDGITAANELIANYLDYGLTKIDHEATVSQNYPVTDYRYQGASPNNYILYNGELWRIIGVFEVENESGKAENRIKIIRDTPIANAGYNHNSADYNTIVWDDSTLKNLLNNGAYFNRYNGATQIECSYSYGSSSTTCEFANNGLTPSARAQISDAKWYLSNADQGYNTVDTYNYERGPSVHIGNSATWIGKVALPYPSDYGYASSACSGTNTAIEDYYFEECTESNWMFHLNEKLLTITPFIGEAAHDAFYIKEDGALDKGNINNNQPIRPSVYLDATIKFVDGIGTSENPFTM